jgi:glycerol-3-phosphate cytidylyltransferase
MIKKRIGYTTGVFDLFHIGHLNILRTAKEMCDILIVGVTVDELVYERKKKNPVIPFSERIEIVKSIRYVDKVVSQESMNKMSAWERFGFDVIFVGDDWKGHHKWEKIESEMNQVGVEIIYLPYTKRTSSTILTETLRKLNEK